MRVLQVSPTKGMHCGVALFAERLASELAPLGFEVNTVAEFEGDAGADLVLLQHHVELMEDERAEALCSEARQPVVLFAHSDGVERAARAADALMAMHAGIVPETRRPALVFPHPARTPECLAERGALRERFGLPPEGRVVGTCGFLKFERQFIDVLSALLPFAARAGWTVQLVTSPWYLDSPGLLEEIGALGDKYAGHLRHEHGHLTEEELNLRLQACDLLWCWTKAASGPYASGVASDLYASGSRVVAADKMQHEHILGLPNVVRAPATLAAFLEELLREMRRGVVERHDPAPVSWERQSRAIAGFLHDVARGVRRGV